MAIILDNKSNEVGNLIFSLLRGVNLDKYKALNQAKNVVDKDADKLLKYINESNTFDRIMLTKLFKKFDLMNMEFDLFSFVFYWVELSVDKNFDEFLSALRDIDEKIVFNHIYWNILKLKLDDEDLKFPNEDINIEKVLHTLSKIEGDAEFKWYITEVCLDIKGFCLECSKFLEKCRKILSKKLMAFKDREESLYKKLNTKIDNEGLAFFKDLLEEFEEENYKNTYIIPISVCKQFLWLEEATFSSNAIFFVGEDFETIGEMFSLKNERIWIQNVIKYLSDDSRFKLMKYLKEKPYYGNQLAQKLGLSGATISHHLNTLFLIKLIDQVKYDGKCHFKIRNDIVEKFTNIFKDEFQLKNYSIKVNDVMDELSSKDLNEEDSVNIIKCLSDKNRYELLRLLTEKEMYGEELSRTLELSGGTISYHTKALLSNELISEKRVNNRIYYYANKELLLKWVIYFEENFKANSIEI